MLETYPDLLKPKEVQEIFSISHVTLRRWDKKGTTRVIKISSRGDRRYLKSDILNLLK